MSADVVWQLSPPQRAAMLFYWPRLALAMTRLGDWFKEKAPPVHKFLTRRDRPYPLVRELLAGILGLLFLVTLLYGLTGQSLQGGYPVVVVTSGSMMHCSNYPSQFSQIGSGCDETSYGRIGTIDPGDLVFVRHISGTDQVDTKAKAGASGHYGESGDVVVYRPHRAEVDQQVTPIIHRALFWLEVTPNRTVKALESPGGPAINATVEQRLAGCVLTSREGLTAAMSGFVTRGDNNLAADQCPSPSFSFDPVRLDYILGKARGELPWIGLVKLFVDDVTGHTSNFDNAGGDSKVMLLVTVIVLIGAPWIIDIVLRRRHRRKMAEQDAQEETPEPGSTQSRRKGKGES